MPIDTSIYNQLQAPRIESPLTSLASVLPAIEGLQKNKLMQQQMADTETLNNLYKGAVGTDGKIDRTALLTGAAQGGLGSKIPGMQKQFAEADKETAGALKLGLENGLKQFEVIGQAMSGVRDQATYTSAKQQLASVFPEIAQKMPDVYDPGTIERNRARAVAVKDQMEQALKQLTLEETQRHNKSTESLTARGQNMTDARSREQLAQGKTHYDADRGVIVNLATGEAKPAMQGGVPVGGKDKLPEAQQKQVVGVQNLSNAITEYRAALANFGPLDGLKPDARAMMGTKYNNMMLQAKEAYNLGVLNGPDFQILQSVITDPRSLTGAVTSKRALDTQASELDRIMQGVAQVSSQTKPRGGTGPATQQAGPKAGTVQDGYRFKGGNPADPSAWEKV